MKYLNLAEGVADAPALVSSWGEDEVGDDHHHLHDDNDDDCDDDDDDDDDDTYHCWEGDDNDDHHPGDCDHTRLFKILDRDVHENIESF